MEMHGPTLGGLIASPSLIPTDKVCRTRKLGYYYPHRDAMQRRAERKPWEFRPSGEDKNFYNKV